MLVEAAAEEDRDRREKTRACWKLMKCMVVLDLLVLVIYDRRLICDRLTETSK
jgi:hypothetical protein